MQANEHVDGNGREVNQSQPGFAPDCLPTKIRVLLVDDCETTRRFLSLLLEMEPELVTVGQAGDGLLALPLIRAMKPDVVVMDVDMPRLNGIEATRRILAELANVRVIGFSSDGSEETRKKMLSAGAKAYFVKGATGSNENLVAAIKQASA